MSVHSLQITSSCSYIVFFFFFQAEDGIRDLYVTGVQTCALPIFQARSRLVDEHVPADEPSGNGEALLAGAQVGHRDRSEEHTSELQSRRDLVCRLLLEKKKITKANILISTVH